MKYIDINYTWREMHLVTTLTLRKKDFYFALDGFINLM